MSGSGITILTGPDSTSLLANEKWAKKCSVGGTFSALKFTACQKYDKQKQNEEQNNTNKKAGTIHKITLGMPFKEWIGHIFVK